MKVKLFYHVYSFWVKWFLSLIIFSATLLLKINVINISENILMDILFYSSILFNILFIIGFFPVIKTIKMLYHIHVKGLINDVNRKNLESDIINLTKKMGTELATYVLVENWNNAAVFKNQVLLIGDILKNNLSHKELIAVLAHEFSHKKRHGIQMTMAIIGGIITFYIIKLIINIIISFHVTIAFTIILSCIYLFMPPFIWFGELDSDRYAINYVSKEDLKSGLIKFGGDYVNVFSITHPSIKFRCTLIEKY